MFDRFLLRTHGDSRIKRLLHVENVSVSACSPFQNQAEGWQFFQDVFFPGFFRDFLNVYFFPTAFAFASAGSALQ